MGRVDFAGFMSRTFKILQIAFDSLRKSLGSRPCTVHSEIALKTHSFSKNLKIQKIFFFLKIGKLDGRYVDIKAKPHRLDGFVLFA